MILLYWITIHYICKGLGCSYFIYVTIRCNKFIIAFCLLKHNEKINFIGMGHTLEEIRLSPWLTVEGQNEHLYRILKPYINHLPLICSTLGNSIIKKFVCKFTILCASIFFTIWVIYWCYYWNILLYEYFSLFYFYFTPRKALWLI